MKEKLKNYSNKNNEEKNTLNLDKKNKNKNIII